MISGPSGQLYSPQPYLAIAQKAGAHLKNIGFVKLTYAYHKNSSTTKKVKEEKKQKQAKHPL